MARYGSKRQPKNPETGNNPTRCSAYQWSLLRITRDLTADSRRGGRLFWLIGKRLLGSRSPEKRNLPDYVQSASSCYGSSNARRAYSAGCSAELRYLRIR